MSEIHITLHKGVMQFSEMARIINALEPLGYTAEMVDNGTIILNGNTPQKEGNTPKKGE